MLYSLIKPLLFSLSPEDAHDFILKLARLGPHFGKVSGIEASARLSVKVGKNQWAFPVGLAAGLDKNAEALSFFAAQGFGAIESGTITLLSQLGNPKPRLWRYPEEESLRNAMGFPNQGLLSILPRIKAYEGAVPLGANIGKNKETSPEDSIEELNILFEAIDHAVDYFAINVSSPNTPGLRALQEKSYLSELFSTLNASRAQSGTDLYLKIAPDLDEKKILELAHLCVEHKLTGLIATNTTIMADRGAGGISGKLLTIKARSVRDLLLKENLPLEIIGVGGISSAHDLFDFWAHGGKAAQIYTSYVYQGPNVLHSMKKEIIKFLDQNQLKDLEAFFGLSREDRRKMISQRNVLGGIS